MARSDDPAPPPREGSQHWFATTHWSVVLSAKEGDPATAAGALEHNSNQRAQRLRLWSGWNLCSLAVTAENASAQLAARREVAAAFRWDSVEHGFKEVAPADTIPAGTVLWIEALTNTTVTVRGLYNRSAAPARAVAGGSFHPGALLESLGLDPFVPFNAALWRFDAATQRWQARLSDALFGLSDLPESLAPGEGLFMHVDNEAALVLPDAALGIRYYHQDHLGSSAVITDANGVAIGRGDRAHRREGNRTAMITIATAKAGGGAAKGPGPPPVRPPAPPPAKVVVGQPMSGAGQVAKTQPGAATAAKTVRDPTSPTFMKAPA